MLFQKLIILLFLPSFYISYNLYDTLEINDFRVEAGMVNDHLSTDGYLNIFSLSTNDLIKEVIFDSGENDNFRYLADVGEEYFLVVNEVYAHKNFEEGMLYHKTIILKYNFEGELVNTLVLAEKPQGYMNINKVLIIQLANKNLYIDSNLSLLNDMGIRDIYKGEFDVEYRGTMIINGEISELGSINYPGNYDIVIRDKYGEYEFSFLIEADYKFTGEKQDGLYLGPVTIYSFGELYVNNEIYSPGTPIDTVGNNILVIKGLGSYEETIEFTIKSDITIFDGDNYIDLNNSFVCDYPIRIFSDALHMEIDNESYNSELIDSPGRYELKVFGIGDYEEILNIEIWPKIEGLNDSTVYEELNLNIFGKARVNGKEISGNYHLEEAGDYKLELLFEEDVWKTYNFQILQQESKSSEIYIVFLKYVFLGLGALGLFLFLRKR
jgi:hypothetical protein